MNNELIERIDAVLELWQGVTVLPDDIYLLQDCKAALMCAGADNESLAEQNRKLSDLLTQQQEDYEELQRKYHFLASEMVYEGNSVQHWRQKALAYKECAGVIYELKSLLGVETPADVLEQVKTQQQTACRGEPCDDQGCPAHYAAQPQVPEGYPSDIEVREAVADFMKDTQTLPLEDCAKLLVMRIKALLAAAKEEGK